MINMEEGSGSIIRFGNEAYYGYAMRCCVADGIHIYPVAINSATYCLEMNYDGLIWTSIETYKVVPKYLKDKHWDKEVLKIYQLIFTLKNRLDMKNILKEAASIIFDRDSEKAKDYGPFHDSMKDAAKIMTILTGKHITTKDFYKAMMALKLARLRYSDKHDTYLDLIAYVASASTLKSEDFE